MMPKKTGFVLFKQLKEDKRYRDIPILMISGVAGVLQELEEHKEETFEKPYDNLRESLKQKIQEMREVGPIRPEMFLDKPVDPETFIAKVRQLIGS
jgi:CheY-like chemotaxis protein